MGDAQRRFIVEILLRARDEISAVFQKAIEAQDRLTSAQRESGEAQREQREHSHQLTGELDRLVAAHTREKKAVEGSTSASKAMTAEHGKLSASIDKLEGQYRKYLERLGQGKVKQDEHITQLRRFSEEWAKLSKAAQPGSEIAGRMATQSASARRVADDLVRIDTESTKRRRKLYEDLDKIRVQAQAEAARLEEQGRRDDERAEQESTRRLLDLRQRREKLFSDLAKEASREEGARLRQQQLTLDQETRKLVSESQQLRRVTQDQIDHRAAVLRTTSEYERFTSQIDDGNVTVGEARSQLRRFASDFDRLGRGFDAGSAEARTFGSAAEDARHRIRGLGDETRRVGGDGNGFRSFLRGLSGDSDDASLHMSKLGLALKGFQIAFAIKYAQALLSVLVGLGGALVAVASTAIQAGVALVGSLAAGAAQTIPVIGLLAGALFGIGQVLKAVTLANQQKLLADHNSTQQAAAQEAANERVHDSERALASAHDAVAEAERNMLDAQQGVVDARKEAIRQIQDLIAAERQAELAAQGAGLSLEEQQASLRQAIAGGSAAEVAQAQLGVEQARFDVGQSVTSLSRSRAEATQARRRPDAQPVVQTAQERVIQSQQALTKARQQETEAAHNLARARDQSAAALTKETSGVDRLQAMLAQFSPAQRRIYATLTTLLANVRRIFLGSPSKDGILGPLIDSIRLSLERANKLLKDNRILGALRGLSSAISKEIRRLTRVTTGNESLGFFTFMTKEATDNLPLVGRIFRDLFELIRKTSKAAVPAFRDLLNLIYGYVHAANDAADNTEGLTNFFRDGIDYLNSFIQLGVAALDLIMSLVTAGGSSVGASGIDAMTRALQRAAEWIRLNRSEVRKFFEDSRTVAGQVAHVLMTIGQAVANLFDPSNSQAFVDFLTKILIPALANVISIMGFLTRAAHEFLTLPLISDLAQWVISIALLMRGFQILRGAIDAVILAMGIMRNAFGRVVIANPILLAITAITAALVILDSKFHIFRTFGELFKSNADKAKEASQQLIDTLNRQIEAQRRARDAELSHQQARLARSRAEVGVTRARQEQEAVEKRAQAGELKGKDLAIARRDAALAVKQAELDLKQANLDLSDARKRDREESQKNINVAKKGVEQARDTVDKLKDERKEIEYRREQQQLVVDADEKALKRLTPGTDAYRDAVAKLRISKDRLADIDERLRGNTDDLSDAAKRGDLSFRRWRNAVRKAGSNADDFSDIVNDAMRSVAEDVNQVLTEFGAKPLKFSIKRRKRTQTEDLSGASDIFGTPDIGGIPGKQRGGLTVPGRGDGDKVLMQAMVEPEEKVFVLNRNASRQLDTLHSLNRMFPRFQRGGIVPIPGMPGESIDRRILADVLSIIHNYKAVVTDGYAPTGHAAKGEHPLGLAVDLVPGPRGSWDLIDRLAKWAEPSQGSPRYPFRWVGYTGDPGHGRGNHLHLSWLHEGIKTIQTLRGAIGAAMGIRGRIVDGPSGALKRILDKAMPRTVRAANRYIDRAIGDIGTDTDAVSGDSATGAGAGLMRRISEQMGWNFNDWWALDALETGHGQNLSNPTSTARLRGQFLDMNWGKYGIGSDPRRHPTMAQQIRAMADYIKERWKSPTAALAFHRQNNYYQRGGTVVPFAGAFGDGGSFAVDRPTAFIAGDKGRERVTVTPDIIPGAVRGTAKDIVAALDDLVAKLGVSKGFAKRFRTAFTKIFETGGLFEQMTAAVEQIAVRATEGLQRAQFVVTRGAPSRRLLDVSGTESVLGKRTSLRLGGQVGLQDIELSRRGIASLVATRAGLTDEGSILDRSMRAAQRQLAIARRDGDKKAAEQARAEVNKLKQRIDSNNQALAQNAQDMVQAQESFQQAVLDAVTTGADRSKSALDRQQRLMTALGRAMDPGALADRQIGIIRRQIDELRGVRDMAAKTGNVKLAQQVSDQIDELNVTIAEAVAQRFQSSIDVINQNAQRSLGAIDRRARMADLTGDFNARASLTADRGQILANQRTGLQALLLQAMVGGNITQIESLSDQISELDVTIAENTKAAKDNTRAQNQAAIDRITGRQSFLGGITSSAVSLLQSISSMTGTDSSVMIASILHGAGATLEGTGRALVGRLRDIFGIDLRGLNGAELVRAILALDFDKITSTMSDDDRTQFEALIGAIVSNEQAVVDNTKQLQDLTIPGPQSFSSTAWQRFGLAIFNGANGLIPSLTPAFDIGGFVTNSSLSGSSMTNSSVSTTNVTGERGKIADSIVVQTTSPTVMYDPVDQARQLGAELNNRVR